MHGETSFRLTSKAGYATVRTVHLDACDLVTLSLRANREARFFSFTVGTGADACAGTRTKRIVE